MTRQVWGRVSDPSKPSKARQALYRWLKFNLVGGIGIAVQLLALAIFRSLLHLDYLLATALAVETAVLHNFLWHERFTWADRPALRFTHSLVRLARFNATNGAVSILGNLLLMRWMVGELRLNYLASNLVAVSVCSLVNFLLSDRLVFERKENGFSDDGNVTLAR
jgi:putative flippase GtrA